MTITDTLEKRTALEERFQGERSWREGTALGVPSWYAQLVTDLILATGEDEIRYFSAKYLPARGGNRASMAVVAFTDDLVAYANLDNDPAGNTPLEVIVTARRQLTSFSVESSDASELAANDPLAGVRIAVNYPEFSRVLPLGESDWKSRGSETADLIARLRRDLVA